MKPDLDECAILGRVGLLHPFDRFSHLALIREFVDEYAAVSPQDEALDFMMAEQMNTENRNLFQAKIREANPQEFLVMILEGISSHENKDLKAPEMSANLDAIENKRSLRITKRRMSTVFLVRSDVVAIPSREEDREKRDGMDLSRRLAEFSPPSPATSFLRINWTVHHHRFMMKLIE